MAAGLVIALHWFTFFQAIKVSNISVTLACLSTGAFFTCFMEPIFYRRKIILYEVFFGLLVIVGLYIIFSFEGNYLNGILLALSSAFLSATFSIINGKYAVQYNPVIISFYELLGGVFFFSIYLLFSGAFYNRILSTVSVRLAMAVYIRVGLYGLCVYSICAGNEIP